MERSFSNKDAEIQNEEKIKFDKIFGEHNGRSPIKQGGQNSNFLIV